MAEMREILRRRPAWMAGKWYEDFADTERLVVVYNNNCTAACAHCISESTPKSKGKVALADALDYVDAAADRGVRWMCLTGGEALIYRDDCLEILARGKRRGLTMAIETNAFWGRSPKIAEVMLAELAEAGLSHLPISADAHHLPYVSLERVLNVARAARALQVSHLVFMVYSSDEATDRMILDALDAEDLLYEASSASPFGFAELLPSIVFRVMDVPSNGFCGELGPLVIPGGDVFGCCNPHVSRQSPLYRGNLSGATLSKMIEDYAADEVIDEIRTEGFAGLYREIIDDPALGPRYRTRRYRHICEVCRDVFADPELTARFLARRARRAAPQKTPPDRDP